MIVMALDHVRDYLSIVEFDATDLAHTTPALFLTRWVTHYCAPVFILLAGTSAYLSRAGGKPTAVLSRFLFTRGLWLVILELTVVRVGWTFDLDPRHGFVLQVIWAIGVSMMCLSALVFLPVAAVTTIGVVMITGHNLLDGVVAEQFGTWAWGWYVLHEIHPPVIYPLVPWVGVMAAGYGLGAAFDLAPAHRRRVLLSLGTGLTLGFVVLRAINRYGDPSPWVAQSTLTYTALSFLNVTKYPPSLLYVLMTLGPAIALLPVLERWSGPLANAVLVFGRVPLFYYVLHLYVIHALAMALGAAMGFEPAAFLTIFMRFPPQFGVELPAVYAAWVAVVAVLYWPCRWFAGLKQRRNDVWLSYL